VPVLARVSRFRRRALNAWRITAELPDKRRSLPRWAVFELMRPATPLAAVEHDGIRYLVRTRDRGVGRVTYITGHYDLHVMEDALARLRAILGRDVLAGRVFVDVGANVGTSSIPAVRRFGATRALAFEAAEENFRILAANVALNGMDEQIAIRHVGVSDRPGVAQLELAPRNSGDNRVRTAAAEGQFDAYHENRRPTAEVGLVRLDDALAEAGVDAADVGLLWVDTQGHEGHVLAGARGLLAAGVPVFCEYWPYGLRRAGGLDTFNEVVARTFREVVDARADRTLPAARVGELADRYPGERYSDLILVP
jgi:FkbM family methyltransferase